MQNFEVLCGPTANDGHGRLVILRTGDGREYRDTVETNSGYHRQGLLERAALQFDVPLEELASLDAEIVKAADAEDQQTESDRANIEFHRLTCAELDAGEYDLEYLIDNVLVARQPCILAGSKKSLKTSLLIDLGISLAVGGHFLGKLPVNRACRVGLMSGESGLGTIQETARRIAAAAGYQLSDIGGLIFSDDLPQFGHVGHEEALRRFIMADELEIIGIDPAYLCLPAVDHSNLFQVGERLRGMAKVCQETGAMLLVAHHTKRGKVDPFGAPELEDIAWAGFQEWCRQWLLIGRRERYEPGTGEHRLWLSFGGSAGHSALWAADIAEGTRETEGGRYWSVSVMRADEAREEVQARKDADREAKAAATLESDQRAILKIMAGVQGGDTKNGLRDRAPFGHSRFDRAFSTLVAEGSVQGVELLKRNKQTYAGWKLADDPEET